MLPTCHFSNNRITELYSIHIAFELVTVFLIPFLLPVNSESETSRVFSKPLPVLLSPPKVQNKFNYKSHLLNTNSTSEQPNHRTTASHNHNSNTFDIENEKPNFQNRTTSHDDQPKMRVKASKKRTTQPEKVKVESWPDLFQFPKYEQIDEILTFAEELHEGLFGGSTSSNSKPQKGKNQAKINRQSTHTKNKHQLNQKFKLTTESPTVLSHRFGLPVPMPIPMQENQNSEFNPPAPMDGFFIRKQGGSYYTSANRNFNDDDDDDETTTESMEYETSTKYPGFEETTDDEEGDPEDDLETAESGSSKSEDPTATDSPDPQETTLAPFALSDIQIPVGFLRTEFMIGYCFLGLMYGLGFLVFFQSICVPIAKFFVFISYLWAVYFGVLEPITKHDAMQYLPPLK